MKNDIEMNSAQETSNEASVAYFADKIKSEMKTATCAWRSVAELFAAASSQFSTDSDNFKQLLKATNFSRSKAYKLIAIANDDRLKMYEDMLQCVSAWTVMYEITTLKGDEFQRFINIIQGDTVVTSNEVNAARVKEAVIADPFKTLFSIQIDENAMKAQLFSGDEYQELLEAIETIQSTMNYVRVEETKVFENDVARFHSQVERVYAQLVRKTWNEEKKAFFARCKCKTTIAEVKEDIQTLFDNGDYKEAFSLIDSDGFDQAQLFNDAFTKVHELRERKFDENAAAAEALANKKIKIAA
jgi:hypothetical protein